MQNRLLSVSFGSEMTENRHECECREGSPYVRVWMFDSREISCFGHDVRRKGGSRAPLHRPGSACAYLFTLFWSLGRVSAGKSFRSVAGTAGEEKREAEKIPASLFDGSYEQMLSGIGIRTLWSSLWEHRYRNRPFRVHPCPAGRSSPAG